MDENMFYCEMHIFRIELDVTMFRRNQVRTQWGIVFTRISAAALI